MTPDQRSWARQNAVRWERDGVTRLDTDRLASTGAYGLTGPVELGGVPAAEHRSFAEALSGDSPDLWFVWFQHGPVLRMLSADPAPAGSELLADLCSGRTQAGVAFSHLRSGRPTITAEREKGGWRLVGTQAWCTGWGIIDVVLVGAYAPQTQEALLGLMPASANGLTSAGELDLVAMRGTSTHALRVEDGWLPDDAVVVRRNYQEWLAADRITNSNVQPSTFGIASAALDLLAHQDAPTEAALRSRLNDLRTQAYALIDDHPPDVQVPRRLEVRAEALLLAMQSTCALVASRGGRAMGMDDSSQLLLRAAAFQLVHAQAPHVREATLAAYRA